MSPTTFRLALLGAASLIAFSSVAFADLRVSFDEGAPKDRFRFENTSDCTINAATVLLNLSTSSAGLIFDVTGQGAGVEVFQPFEIIEGAAALSALTTVSDGDNQVELKIATLAPGKAVAFTIDVDDTIGQREITVSGSEINGATVELSVDGATSSATFPTSARLNLPLTGC